MNKAEQLIACLEGEIAKRDEELAACRVAVENCEVFRARIAELEDDLKCAHSMLCEVSKSGMVLRAELAAIKAQEPVAWKVTNPVTSDELLCNYKPGGLNYVYQPIYAAPVSEAKAQGVVMPDVNAAANALCNRHAMICGVDADDQWKEYSQDFIADAETVLANARLNAAPVQQVSVPDGFERYRLADKFCDQRLVTDDHVRAIVVDAFASGYGFGIAAAPATPAADAGVTDND